MATYTYKTIVNKAKAIKTNVEKEYKVGESPKWSYYFAQAIIKPNVAVTKMTFNNAPKSHGVDFSRQITKSKYMDMAKRLVAFVKNNRALPNNITVDNKLMRVSDYTYMFARILVYYDTHNKQYPAWAEVNSKAFTKPFESDNDVYNYFVKKFGKISCIDDALGKVSKKGYGYYYDDKKSNKETIDAMANSSHSDDPNCTDSCHVFYNLGLVFVKKGLYKKVECLHVRCSGGDGHVRLRYTKKDGSTFLRDPACTLSDGGYCNWCTKNYTLLAVNPAWFMQNLNR